ncbi:uncharacterized protein LOC113859616 [Abrus precatorius]|uniref:Uncharacterized protein LOC113859616 n=1 Tax=Abrus precatorius TaxID=3816 RepID=A0A8B8KW66_ABRPR|nr:uncharacterized protein LOC113859616 [Abrus precatorius]
MKALSILPMPHSFLKSNDVAPIPAKPSPDFDEKHETNCDNGEESDENQEFTFASINLQGTLVFADEIFDNGQIRPTYHAFDQSLIFTASHDNETMPLRPPLKKVFVKQVNSFSSNSKVHYKETLQETMVVEVDALSNKCKKSNSTGFSKKWRFRKNLNLRSNSDGKDAFVSLNPSLVMPMRSIKAKEENVALNNKKHEKSEKCKTLSAHEKLYVSNRKRRESTKKKSCLPYKKELIGFFANMNGFSRNLHPF